MRTEAETIEYPRYPPDVAERYRSAGLWGNRTIAEEFRLVAARFGECEAVVDRRRRLSYLALDQNSDAVAAGLLASGLRAGDRVTLQVGNTVESIELLYGLLKAGLIPVCTLQAHRHHEIDAIAATVGARAHAIDLSEKPADKARFAFEVRERVPHMTHLIQVSPGEQALLGEDVLSMDNLRATPADVIAMQLAGVPEAGADDLAIVQLSGGTSGTPKLIPRLHAEYWYNGRATAERWAVSASDRVAHVIPIVHNAGMHGALWPAHSSGACLVLDHLSRGLDVFETLAAERITGMLMPASILDCADHPLLERVISNMRWISLSGSAVPPALFDRLTRWGVTVAQNFGMTEGIVLATPLDSSEEIRRRTVGFPISPYDEVHVVDPSDPTRRRGLGEAGELIARGPYTIRGYINARDHNAGAFTPDGFYRTGDVVSAVEIDGVVAYQVEGRIKDVINRGGEKVNAAEVESLLMQHPRIFAAAVVAMPDLRLGERACAFVESGDSQPITLDEVRAYLDALDVAKFKWPERIETRAELPRTAVGKIAKRVLAAEIETICADEMIPNSHQGVT